MPQVLVVAADEPIVRSTSDGVETECEERGSVDVDVLDRATWRRVVVAVRGLLPGEIAAYESIDTCQIAHYETGLRITLSDDNIYLWSSYSLGDVQRDRVAQKLRDVAFEIELVTGRTAVAVRYDQPELLLADVSGLSRIHGYAIVGRDGEPQFATVHSMRLPASALFEFDLHTIVRNRS